MGGSDIGPSRSAHAAAAASQPVQAPGQADAELFHGLYRDHFDFVFRNLRRLGVPPDMVDDAVQEVFLVVLRHLGNYRPGSSPKAWLFAIALRVSRNRRRSLARRGSVRPLSEEEYAAATGSPFDATARGEARRVLHEFLATLEEDRRSVFVMAELEQMTAPEIADILGVNVNTIYGRLRTARREFARLVSMLHPEPGRDDG